MLLTNISAAQFIAVNLPEQALLRRHDSPIERRLVCRRAHWYLKHTDLSYRKALRNVHRKAALRWMSPMLGVS
jgi:exoribonuclease R